VIAHALLVAAGVAAICVLGDRYYALCMRFAPPRDPPARDISDEVAAARARRIARRRDQRRAARREG